MKCKVCRTQIPQARWDLGYRTCVSCSQEEKWSSVPVINHKTGNEIQIIKDPEVAAEFLAKSARKGFGTLRGMSSSYKRHVATANVQPGKIIEAPLPLDCEIARKALPHKFSDVGEKVMEAIEAKDKRKALETIDSALKEKLIWKNQARQLQGIVETLCN